MHLTDHIKYLFLKILVFALLHKITDIQFFFSVRIGTKNESNQNLHIFYPDVSIGKEVIIL